LTKWAGYRECGFECLRTINHFTYIHFPVLRQLKMIHSNPRPYVTFYNVLEVYNEKL